MKPRKFWSLKKAFSSFQFLILFSVLLLSFQNCTQFNLVPTSSDSASLSVADYDQINSKLLTPKCVSCHNSTVKSGGIDLSSYSKLMTSNVVTPYDSERSLLYIVLANGSMPEGGPPVSSTTLLAIKTWIDAGALEQPLAPQICTPPKNVLPRLSHFEYENILNDILDGKLNATALKSLPELPPLFGFDNISDSKIDKVTAEAYFSVAEDMVGQLLASTSVMSACPVRPFYLQTWENCGKEIVNSVAEKLYRRPLRPTELQNFKNLFQSNLEIGITRIRSSTEAPVSNVDGLAPDSSQIVGWAYDPDWPERAVEILFYAKAADSAEAPTYIGSALSNQPRADVNSATGIIGDRGFVFSVPATYLNNQIYTITVKVLANAQDVAIGNPFNMQGSFATPPSTRLEFSPTFTDGLKSTLIAALMSPNFLFKMEYFPGGFLSDESSFRNAAKLSLALGSTYPDSEAWNLAKNSQYVDRDVLAAEAQRLIVKYKSRFSVSFGGQWLGFKKLFKKAPASIEYSMAMESKLVLEKIIADDLLSSKLLSPGFSYLNSTLAGQYQMQGNFTPETFSMVPTPLRGGLLSQGQFLTRTATSIESHPIKRGIWVLDTLLCSALPVLSAATFEEIANAQSHIDPTAPLSERMRAHRSSSARCSTCHNQIDPIGLALDNWDRNGLYRTKYPNGQLVQSGLLFNGTRVSNPYELGRAVADSPQFRNCVKRKITAYINGINPTQPESCSQNSPVNTDKSIRALTTDTMVEALLKEQ